MLPTQVSIAEKLRFALAKRNMPVTKLSEHTGIQKNTLYRMLNHEDARPPYLVEIVKISIALGTSVDFFVGLRKFEDSELPFPWGYRREG